MVSFSSVCVLGGGGGGWGGGGGRAAKSEGWLRLSSTVDLLPLLSVRPLGYGKQTKTIRRKKYNNRNIKNNFSIIKKIFTIKLRVFE